MSWDEMIFRQYGRRICFDYPVKPYSEKNENIKILNKVKQIKINYFCNKTHRLDILQFICLQN